MLGSNSDRSNRERRSQNLDREANKGLVLVPSPLDRQVALLILFRTG